MDRLERLINLVAALKAADRPLTRAELQERVPGYPPDDASARRQFERDKDALRSMGIPISVERLPSAGDEAADGYRIRAEDYELPDPGLDAEELAALHLATSAVRLEGAEAEAAIWKLGGAAVEEAEQAAEAIAMAGSEHLPILFAALAERRPVRFAYKDQDRTVDPWRLSFRNGRWYLTAHDHGAGDERQFRLDRMGAPEAAGPAGAFDRPAGAGADAMPPPWRMGDEPPLQARVLVDPGHADWAVRHVGEEAVAERRADGAVVLALTVTNRDAFRSFVLGFLDHAEVLEPEELRSDVIRWLEALA